MHLAWVQPLCCVHLEEKRPRLPSSRVHHYFRAGARGGPGPIIAIHTHRVFILWTRRRRRRRWRRRWRRQTCAKTDPAVERESYYFQERPAARTLVFYLFAFVCKTRLYTAHSRGERASESQALCRISRRRSCWLLRGHAGQIKI